VDTVYEGKVKVKIGITGAQSVGKTTLLNALRSEKLFERYAVCDEVTRRVKSYGLPINEGGNDTTQLLIMKEHIYNVFMYDNMITDRTALDGFVYSTYLFKHDKISDKTMRTVTDIFHEVWKHYDHVFYIEPEFEIVDDGVRSIDSQFRDEIAELFKSTIEKKSLSMHRVKGTVRNRVSVIMDYLEGR
jgi:GTPase SAR1 family protein